MRPDLRRPFSVKVDGPSGPTFFHGGDMNSFFLGLPEGGVAALARLRFPSLPSSSSLPLLLPPPPPSHLSASGVFGIGLSKLVGASANGIVVSRASFDTLPLWACGLLLVKLSLSWPAV